MRSLIFIFLFVFSPQVFSESISFQTFYQDNAEKFGAIGNLIERNRTIKGTVLGLNDLKIKSVYLGSSLTVQDPDSGSYKVLNSDGVEENLNGAELEALGSLELRYYNGSHGYTVSLFSDFIQTPFMKRGVSGIYEYKARNGLSIYKIKASYLHQEMPRDYYSDENFIIQKRVSRVFGRSASVEWEQIISKMVRSSLTIAARDRKNERPLNYGSELKIATAINDSNFIHLNLEHYQEDQSEELISNLGYFTYSRAGIEYLFEPSFEYIISLSYHYTSEREDNPIAGTITEVAIDSYGLGGSFMLEWGELFFSSVYSMTNINESFLKLSCGVKWDI